MGEEFRKWSVRVGVGLLLLVALAYPVDWAVWAARGNPTTSVTVTRFVVAPLKGSKEEYYPDGTEAVDCSQTVLPQTGAGACWWVQRHAVVFDR